MVSKSTSKTSSISCNSYKKGLQLILLDNSFIVFFLLKDMDKSSSSPHQTDDEEDDDDIDIEENVDEEHATSSNSN